MKDDPVYLDNAATTPLAPEVLDAMRPWLESRHGNAAAVYYGPGRDASDAVEAARADAARLLNASPEEIHFTSGATESNNWVLSEILLGHPHPARRRAVTAAAEHHAVLEPLAALHKRHGFPVTVLPVDGHGRLDPSAFADALTPDDVAIASVMLVNNEVGTINHVARLAALARERGVPFHTDATQAVGKIPVDVKTLGVDFASLSAHKFNGPKGVGALYIRRGARLGPLLHGGGQERGRRAGTTNVAGIVGLGAAARLAERRAADPRERRRLAELVDRMWNAFSEALPKIRRNGDPFPDGRIPGLLSLCVEGAEGEAILGYLDMYDIQVSSGSACTSGSLDPSHVLLAMGVPVEIAHGSIRFSLGHETTAGQIDRVIGIFPEVVNRVRSMSVTWKG